jgi:adenylate cyclase
MSVSAFERGVVRGRRRIVEGVVTLGALVVLALVSLTPQYRQLEFKTLDAYMALLARGAGDVPIVIVAIDEPSFRELGVRWPFPRRLHADLIDRAAADGARVIAFDLLFAEPAGSEDDARLADAIRRARNVVVGKTLEPSETATAREWTRVEPLPALVAAGARAGEVGVDPDADFVVRVMPPFADSFDREIVRALGGAVPANAEGADSTLIRYAGPHGSFPTVHYYQAVLPGLLPAGFFKDKIVLVGLDVHGSPEITRKQADLYNSPFIDADGGVMSGVEIHANIVANLLDGRALRHAAIAWHLALAALLVLVVTFAGSSRGPVGAAVALVIATVASLGLGYVLFTRASVWLSPLLAIAAATWVYVVQTAAGFLIERRRANETKRAFAQYVPAEVVHRLVERPELLQLGGEERELTLLFADLANFTSLSERMAPPAVVAMLGRYFDAMSRVIYRHGGTVDKYIGDGIMAFWGAPLPDADHASHAVQAATDMQRVFERVSRRLTRAGGQPLAMRIGIHTGNVVVGNVGSRARFAYTAIGDAVNLASRLEGANKVYGTAILLTDATAERLRNRSRLRAVDSVIVKGRTDAVRIYTPCTDAKLVDLSRVALDAYVEGAWDRSAAAWREILGQYPGDGVATVFLRRIETLRAEAAPADWTGATALDKL